MENKIVAFLLPHLNHWGYYILLVITFLETSAFLGLLVPGESVVVIAGLLASQGVLKISEVIWVASFGAIMGDTAGYFIGKRFGKGFFLKYGKYFFFKKEYFDEAEGFFEKHGGKAVFFGRFMGWLRAFAPVVAGISRMRYSRFLLFNVTGGIAWATAISLLGYFAGNSWDIIHRYLGRLGIVAFICGTVAAYCYVLFAKKRHPVPAKLNWMERTLSNQIPGTWDFIKARFEAGTWYGLNMTIGILLFVLATVAYREIVRHQLDKETIVYFDVWIRQVLEGMIGPTVARFVAGMVNLGAVSVTAVTASLMALYLLYRRLRWDFLGFFVVVGLGEFILYLFRLFSRSLRPIPQAVAVHIYALPSSYSFSAMIVFGYLIYMIGRSVNTAIVRIVIYFLSTLFIILIGISRIYLNVHWLTILGGYAAGLAWLVFGVIIVNTIRQMVFDRRNGIIR